LFDKWTLGPLRLINLLAWLIVLRHYAPWLRKRLPPLQPLQVLGSASLAVFVAHLVIALLLLAWLGEIDPQRSPLVDLAVLAGSFAVLYAVAWSTLELDRRSAQSRQRLQQKGLAVATAVALRSRAAIARSRPG
jgi:hypothetical protein